MLAQAPTNDTGPSHEEGVADPLAEWLAISDHHPRDVESACLHALRMHWPIAAAVQTIHQIGATHVGIPIRLTLSFQVFNNL